jgi:hypothetical protein
VTRVTLIVACSLTLLCAAPAPAGARAKKGIWGPVSTHGVSRFPVYKRLGATVYNAQLSWAETATRRPARPGDPQDPAYRWPTRITQGVRQSGRHRMQVALRVAGTPAWANGNRPQNWAPDNPGDYADFIAAAARRYPGVRYWIIWGEPTRAASFSPLPPTNPSASLTLEAVRSVHRYAAMLDRSYVALKRISRRKVVVGGNSFTAGDISPLNWIRYMRLPNGRRPRMDLYGHNPFSARRPRLADHSIVLGYADFSDLDALARWLDRYYGHDPRGKRMRIWIGEWTAPTDHANHAFNFWVKRATQAAWLRSALRIARRWPRIYAFNWFTLYDETPRPAGDETDWGLIDATGRRKPAFYVFERG